MPRIVRFNKTGGPEVLKLYDEPLQEPGEGAVRFKVEAIGLNRAEVMFRDGKYAADPVFPSRIGIEGSGTIDALGAGVTGFKVGDKIAAIPFLSWDKWNNWTAESVMRYGIYGESAIVPAYTVVPNPDNISMVEAAAIWCQYLTAWGGIINYAKLTTDDIALITAASSSAGLGGLQIAKLTGAMTIAVTRPVGKKQFLLDAGADHVIVTDDNPRDEDPATVRREILAACPGAEEIGNRGRAIVRGIGVLQPGDVLIVAGKGHETGQVVRGEVRPFDDTAVIRKAALGQGRHT